jgi:hypothetical protein
MIGAATVLTVTVATALSALPALLLTRTQKLVVAVSAGVVNDDEFVPTGVVVTPAAP